MAAEGPKAVVIDNGSSQLTAGLAGDTEPKAAFANVVARGQGEVFCGLEAQKKAGVLDLKWPVERGIITNWDDMEAVWHHVYKTLGVASRERPVMMTDGPHTPKPNREKMTQIMFETFNSPSMFVCTQAVLGLYASGRYSGIVLDSGDGVTHAVPIFNGYGLTENNMQLDVAGRDLTDYLMKLVAAKGVPLEGGRADHRQTIIDMKEAAAGTTTPALTFVSQDFEKDLQTASEGASLNQTYKLPDGKEVTLGSERFQCPEPMFQPTRLGVESAGVHQMIHNSIQQCDMDVRKELYSNIVLVGGNTLFQGFADRLQKEVTALANPAVQVNVIAAESRKSSVWIGGSILASLADMKDKWITKQEYEESGASIVHKKCY